MFIKCVRGYDSSEYAMWIIFPGRLSYPVAFRGFTFFKANDTCWVSTNWKLIECSGFLFPRIFSTLGWELCLLIASVADVTLRRRRRRRNPNGWKSISMSRNFKCYKSHFTVSILVYLTFYGLWYTVKQVSFTRYRQTCILLTFIDFKTYYRPLPVCLFTLVAKAVTTVTVSGHRACDTPPPSKTLVTHECTRTATPWQTGRSMNWWASSPTHHWSQLKVPLELSPSNITLTKIVALMRPKHSKN